MNAKNIKIGDVITFLTYGGDFPSYTDGLEYICKHNVNLFTSKIQNLKVESIKITQKGMIFTCEPEYTIDGRLLTHKISEKEVIGVNLKTDEIRNNAIREFLKNKKKEKIAEIQKLLQNLQNLSFTPMNFCNSKTYWEYIEAKVKESKES